MKPNKSLIRKTQRTPIQNAPNRNLAPSPQERGRSPGGARSGAEGALTAHVGGRGTPAQARRAWRSLGDRGPSSVHSWTPSGAPGPHGGSGRAPRTYALSSFWVLAFRFWRICQIGRFMAENFQPIRLSVSVGFSLEWKLSASRFRVLNLAPTSAAAAGRRCVAVLWCCCCGCSLLAHK